MVVRPRESDWDGLRGMLKDGEGEDGLYRQQGNGSFDGADQGLLNEWFSEEGGGGDWNRLSFAYVAAFQLFRLSRMVVLTSFPADTTSPPLLRILGPRRINVSAIRSAMSILLDLTNHGRAFPDDRPVCQMSRERKTLTTVSHTLPAR